MKGFFQLNELNTVYDDVQDRIWEIEKVLRGILYNFDIFDHKINVSVLEKQPRISWCHL